MRFLWGMRPVGPAFEHPFFIPTLTAPSRATVIPAPAANLRAWTLGGKPVPLEPIPVERIDGPVLTAGAGDDHVWGSPVSVHAIEHRLTAHRFRFAHDGVVYPHAGHFLGTAAPYLPTSTEETSGGGTPRADAAARADLWRRILRFFAGPLSR
jgi:dienelactone hydrolase